MNPVRRELEYFFGAVRFFTRLPVPAWVGHSAEMLNHSARYFTLVGLIVGLIGALVFALTSFFFPKTLAVLLAMAATILVTGAFHEDGWADMVDGFGGGWTRERTLEIMKDSRIGSYGAIALVLLLLAKFMALVELDMLLVAPALIAGHALSRLCATSVMHFLDYARDEGKAKPLATRISLGELAVAGFFGLIALVLLPPLSVITGVLLAAAATAWLTRKFKHRLGGYTGDCLGATQQLAEVAFYLGLLCRFS
ncbi:MAG: adenosylcobinamide-GDP ribazoletransferase [Betaproteobacteria bacterium]|nr:adenosylcobinamide-GDP ribazoletransferase [Betaproteobacteria bacterium]